MGCPDLLKALAERQGTKEALQNTIGWVYLRWICGKRFHSQAFHVYLTGVREGETKH